MIQSFCRITLPFRCYTIHYLLISARQKLSWKNCEKRNCFSFEYPTFLVANIYSRGIIKWSMYHCSIQIALCTQESIVRYIFPSNAIIFRIGFAFWLLFVQWILESIWGLISDTEKLISSIHIYWEDFLNTWAWRGGKVGNSNCPWPRPVYDTCTYIAAKGKFSTDENSVGKKMQIILEMMNKWILELLENDGLNESIVVWNNNLIS